MSSKRGPEQRDAVERAASAAFFFRRAYLVQNMCLHPDDDVEFSGIGEHGVRVNFENASRDERSQWSRSPSVRCTITLQCELPRRCSSVFSALWLGQTPAEMAPEDIAMFPDDFRNGSTDPIVLRTPAFLGDSLARVDRILEGELAWLVGVVRWRCNRSGPIALPPLGLLQWSKDGTAWKLDVRRSSLPDVSPGPDLVVTEERRREIEAMLAAAAQEPLHQSLLREAESLLDTNPRSALVIGATATEVAVKALVSHLAPSTSWLVQHVPSPPIVRILEEYLPLLLPAPSPCLDPQLLKGLKAAVTLRNELVHGARSALDAQPIADAFLVFRDVVWLCDYLSGMPWAANRVSSRTIAAMKLPASTGFWD